MADRPVPPPPVRRVRAVVLSWNGGPLVEEAVAALLATDWDNYAEQMMEVMSGRTDFINPHGAGEFAPRADRVLTRFEQRAHRLGHTIHDLAFVRQV